MKILLIVNNVFYQKKDGLYTYRAIGEFANELIKLGNEVEMFQTKIINEDKFHDFNLKGTAIKVSAYKRSSIKLLTYFYIYIIGIYKVFKSDFIYIYYPTNYHFLAFFSIIFRKKYGLNVRGQKGITTKLSKFLYKRAVTVFTVSPEFTTIVNKAGGSGITQRPGISFNSNDIICDRQIVKKDNYRFLYLGRLDKQKGLIELLTALQTLKLKGLNNFIFDIVGDGPDEYEIIEMSNLLNLQDFVIFHGGITELDTLKRFYLNADLFILPTYHEGFPRTLYEAMIFGVPIITTFVGGIASIMVNNYNCIEIKPKSAENIVSAIERVLLNYQDMDNLVKNASETVKIIVDKDRLSHAVELNSVIN